MRISPTSKLGVALTVLRKIKMREKDVVIDTYSNCREQGFFITSYLKIQKDMRAVSFAENRNSDDIIVQYGIRDEFNDQGVFKNDQAYYERKKHFRYNDAEGAAEFITKWLTYQT